MMDYSQQDLKEEFEERIQTFNDALASFKSEIQQKMDDLSKNEILNSIKALGLRLDRIEKRLPSEDDV